MQEDIPNITPLLESLAQHRYYGRVEETGTELVIRIPSVSWPDDVEHPGLAKVKAYRDSVKELTEEVAEDHDECFKNVMAAKNCSITARVREIAIAYRDMTGEGLE